MPPALAGSTGQSSVSRRPGSAPKAVSTTTPRPNALAPGPHGDAPGKSALAKVLSRLRCHASGKQLGAGYQRIQGISSGAGGDVFMAVTNLPDGGFGEVAVKHIRVTNAAINRHAHQEMSLVFLAQEKYAAEVDEVVHRGHPNIVSYLDWFGTEKELFLVMDRCDFALSDVIYTVGAMRSQYERRFAEMKPRIKATDGLVTPECGNADPEVFRFTEREINKVMCQMLSALAFLNRHGIWHRDVKTDNILWQVGPENSEGRYKLADFGTAACVREGETCKHDKNCGTLWIMAPELLSRQPHSMNCDIWSLGVVLFEVAVLERPFSSKELLAYKNSLAASGEGSFWRGITACTSAKTKSSATCLGPSPPGSAKRQVPRSPTFRSNAPATRRSAGAGEGGTSLERAASLPALRTRTRMSDNSVGKVPPLPVGCAGHAESIEGSPSMPGSPQISSRPSEITARKLAFLRKRSGNRWIYGQELRSLIFEDMLEDDRNVRPTASELLEGKRLLALVKSLGWISSSGPHCDRGLPGPTPMSPKALTEVGSRMASKNTPSPIDADTGILLAKLLRHVTGESFKAAVQAERFARQRQADEGFS